MDKVKKLVRYISKYGKCTNKFAANFLLTIFDKNKVFDLSNEKQEIIILNLLSYFDKIVIAFDKYGQLNNNLKITSARSARPSGVFFSSPSFSLA